MSRAVFVLSTGRTGTAFLANFLRGTGVDAHHEPGPFWLRLLSNRYVAGRATDEQLIRALHTHRDGILASSGLYIESTCLMYGFVRPLLSTFEDAVVVQLVRDPRTFVRSAVNWGAYRFGGRPLNVILPYRRLADPQFDPWNLRLRVDWFLKGQFQRLCWAWARMNQHMREQGTGSDRFETICYEDLFDADRGHPGLRRLCEVAGIDKSDEELRASAARPINATARRPFPPWRQWSRDQLVYLVHTCGAEARHYGYDIEAEIGAHVRDLGLGSRA